jgi:Bromodomain
MGLTRKRKIPDSIANKIEEIPSLNGEKMGMGRLKECLTVLKRLMQHQFGWVFNQPVDPVKLGIPDYFSIITNPMDLGTVKEKLLKGRYACPSQFAEDVRLTFTNAMVYNPPKNEVHFMAMKLSRLFDMRWKLLQNEWAGETFNSNLCLVGEKFKKENPNHSSQLAETGPVKKKANLAVAGIENVRSSKVNAWFFMEFFLFLS